VNQNRARVARDILIALALLLGTVVGSLWLAWVTAFEPPTQTINRVIAFVVIVGFGCFTTLFGTLVGVLRVDHYAGRSRSELLIPWILTTAALTAYFGIASISAADMFYQPLQPWPLLRDPGVRLVATGLVFALVAGPAMELRVVLRGRGWSRTRVIAFFAGGVGITALVVWVLTRLGRST